LLLQLFAMNEPDPLQHQGLPQQQQSLSAGEDTDDDSPVIFTSTLETSEPPLQQPVLPPPAPEEPTFDVSYISFARNENEASPTLLTNQDGKDPYVYTDQTGHNDKIDAVIDADVSSTARRRQHRESKRMIRHERRQRRESELTYNYSRSVYPVREWKFTLPFGIQNPITINPLVTFIAVFWLWGLVIWAAGTLCIAIRYQLRALE
jgi:hypothetical protein